MALSKDKKKQVVSDVNELLSSSKMIVLAKYPGTSVKSMQRLRKDSRENGTKVAVIKNRLFIKALQANETFKDVDTQALTGQLLYAFNDSDEVAPAQSLANFAKLEPQLVFVGAITAEGQLLSADDVAALASLPSKQQLRGQLVGTVSAPISGFVNVVAGNMRGVLNVLSARAETIKE